MKRAVLFVALAIACDRTEAPAPGMEAGPDTLPVSVRAPQVEEGFLIVSPDEVREWREAGQDFVLVDARDPVQYRREHIPEAINVPYVDIRAGANLPPRDAIIVVYCSDRDCPISQYAYTALQTLGYTRLYDMREGIQGWKAAGYPTVVGPDES